jgi:hypothetical protein
MTTLQPTSASRGSLASTILGAFVLLTATACSGATSERPASSALDRSSVLAHYLTLKKLPAGDWVAQKDGLVARVPKKAKDRDGKPIIVNQTLTVVASGDDRADAVPKQAFVIQYGEVQPGTDYPENDSYRCELLVGIPKPGGWQLETLETFAENEYEGGTRYARDCAGFKITWSGGFPVLTRELTFGPYIGGIYVTVLQTVHRKDGKYKLTTKELREGELREED